MEKFCEALRLTVPQDEAIDREERDRICGVSLNDRFKGLCGCNESTYAILQCSLLPATRDRTDRRKTSEHKEKCYSNMAAAIKEAQVKCKMGSTLEISVVAVGRRP